MSKKLVVGFILIFVTTLFLLHIQNYFSNSKEIYEKSSKTTVQNFTSFKYKRFGSKWINKLVDENVSTNLKKLNIVTYNVMKSLYFFKERINQIIKHLAKDADVICLQEVTPTLVEYLQTLYVVQNKFEMSHIQGDSLDPFGVVVLSKIPIEKLTILKFPTKMNRNCLISHFKINNEKVFS
jgi:tyrosyl-DNA phosphodiesterase 2